MQISEAFPSKYLKASDLQGRQVQVRMSHATFELIGTDNKLILYFQGKDKGMVLNKTNANNISEIYGDDTDDWAGQPIVLVEAMVDFQGKTVPAIRVRRPNASDAKKPAQQRQPEPVGDPRGDMNDEIPF